MGMQNNKLKYEGVGIVIQARMGSTRLPGKVMKPLYGKPLLGFLLDRIGGFGFEGVEIIVATTTQEEDEVIVAYCEGQSIRCIRGSEIDVFDRYQQVAKVACLSHIVRLTADNPLVDKNVLRFAMDSHLANSAALSSTRKIANEKVVERYVPKGHSVDVIDCGALLEISSENLTVFEQEHVIPVFFNGHYLVNYIKPSCIDLKEMTVDTQAELDNVSAYIKERKVDF